MLMSLLGASATAPAQTESTPDGPAYEFRPFVVVFSVSRGDGSNGQWRALVGIFLDRADGEKSSIVFEEQSPILNDIRRELSSYIKNTLNQIFYEYGERRTENFDAYRVENLVCSSFFALRSHLVRSLFGNLNSQLGEDAPEVCIDVFGAERDFIDVTKDVFKQDMKRFDVIDPSKDNEIGDLEQVFIKTTVPSNYWCQDYKSVRRRYSNCGFRGSQPTEWFYD
jgi:hypothetical protein